MLKKGIFSSIPTGIIPLRVILDNSSDIQCEQQACGSSPEYRLHPESVSIRNSVPMASETEFNPYIDWLEIDPALCPPNYYDLLGIAPFESNRQVIEEAFEQRLALIRTFQTGPRGALTQDIINEVMRARLCLLDTTNKQKYDHGLRTNNLPHVTSDHPADDLSGAPPIVNGDSPFIHVDSGNETGKQDGTNSARKIPVLYMAACVAAVAIIWGLVSWSRSGSATELKNRQTADEDREKPIKPENSPKIVNPVEIDKGILPGANNSFILSAENADTSDSTAKVLDTSDGTLLGNWKPTQTKVTWSIWINTPGYYEAMVSYNATTNGDYSRVVVGTDESFSKSTKMRRAEKLDTFFEEEFIVLFRKAGGHTVTISVEGEPGDFRLKEIILRPNKTNRRSNSEIETDPGIESSKFFPDQD